MFDLGEDDLATARVWKDPKITWTYFMRNQFIKMVSKQGLTTSSNEKFIRKDNG